MTIAVMEGEEMNKHDQAVQYLDQLENALIRIELNQAADWRDVQEAIRAAYWLFREYLRQAEQ